jgi:hypothetical protein
MQSQIAENIVHSNFLFGLPALPAAVLNVPLGSHFDRGALASLAAKGE